MKEKLKKFCKSLNIEYVGVTDVGPYYDYEKLWRKQIERGFVTGFEETDIEKRINPKLTLEAARSVIVCLFPYYVGDRKEANISKYAYALDYHLIIKDKLIKIADYLGKNIENFQYKAFTDNGPLSDRHLAYRAGLGFLSINSNIINDKFGSYILIGYIINNYPFEIDKPQQKTCCKCHNCVKECPGAAILGDFTINPFNCKSFITQKKKELSEHETEIIKQHDLIWGCDVCQDVCPHNKNAQETTVEEFKKELQYYIDYNELKDMSNKEFIKKYRNRAFSWRGKGILIRNYEIIHDEDNT